MSPDGTRLKPDPHGMDTEGLHVLRDGSFALSTEGNCQNVVNPLAETPGSPIYGMPILEAHKARTVIVNKRSMAST